MMTGTIDDDYMQNNSGKVKNNFFNVKRNA
jgi:hypothetical protein